MKRTHEDMAGDDHPNDHPDGHDDANLSDDDDDVGKIAPYDAKKEPRPPCKLYDPDYKKIREDLQTCIDLFASPFHQTSFNSGSTQGLLEELKRRLQDKSAEKVRIGVVGDMKSGMRLPSLVRGDLLTSYRKKLRHQLHPQRRNDCTPGKCALLHQ